METTRFPTNFLTTVKVTFVVQQRWGNGQDWSDVRYVSASHTPERAAEKAKRYRAEIERGDFNNKYGEQCPQPQLRIQQRVSEWTPLTIEI